jgi:hypothetical protein
MKVGGRCTNEDQRGLARSNANKGERVCRWVRTRGGEYKRGEARGRVGEREQKRCGSRL